MNSVFKLIFFLMFIVYSTLSFGQYYFGQNKVQYNRFEWQVLQTRHFDIYYYPEMEDLAEIGAHYAEDAYQNLQDKFDFNINRRIPLVFYSSHFHFEETNTLPYLIPQGLGGFFEFIKGRVVVPSDGSIHQFAHTIRHELVHVFQHTFENRIRKDHRTARMAGTPLWFTEGLAEYWSEDWDDEAEMIIRDGILNQTLIPVQHLWMIQGSYLMYKEGQSILKYISETYGDYKIRRILLNLWKYESFNKTLKMTIGKDEKELNEAWMYSLRKRIFPLLEDHDMPKMVSRRITRRGFNTLPVFYRDDSLASVIFVANRDGYTSIYQKSLVASEKEAPELLIRGERSPEVESLHLQRSRIDVNQNGLLTFTAKSGPGDYLYIYDLKAHRVVDRFQDSTLVSMFSPSWSPNGRQLVFSGLDVSGKRDLYILECDSKQLIRLTQDYYDDLDPDWSPDGRWIVFSSNRTENGESGYLNLFLYDLENRQILYTTFGKAHDRHPVWSLDGRQIAFSSDRGGTPNLWMCIPHQQPPQLKQVTRFATGAYTPCWTDSLSLLYTGFENVSFQIGEFIKVIPKLDSIPAVAGKPVVKDSSFWEYPRIRGDYQLSRIRYNRKFSLDFAQSQVIQDPIYGTSGGGQIAISDLLGNEMYYFLIYNNARASSEFWDGFNVAATRIDLSRRMNHSIGFYRLAGLHYNGYEGYFYERRTGGYGSVSYPLNKFERLETSVNIRHSEKDWIEGIHPRKALLLSNFVSYVKDNSLWGPTGPLDGGRYRVTLGNTVDIRHANVNFTTAIVDLRQYFRLGMRFCHAVRVWGEFNSGKEPLPFVMGGSWDLRGYRLWSLWGSKLALISNELRFPFIDQFYLGFPFGGIGFSSIRGALFMDAGSVWNDHPEDLKGSFGFGIRFRLGGYLVLRLDMGRKTDFKSVEDKNFTQFFFGWDF